MDSLRVLHSAVFRHCGQLDLKLDARLPLTALPWALQAVMLALEDTPLAPERAPQQLRGIDLGTLPRIII